MTITTEPNYPLNTWYAVASSDEVTKALTARRVLDRPVVLFRRADGDVVALQDRCGHRQLPLSMGQLVDDTVVCRYHGFTYSSTGRCVRVPSQETVPYDADITSYPVREDPPFVWIWLGNPRRAATVPHPRLPWLQDPAWTVVGGVETVAANYLLVHENALDRTHFPFVHPDTSHSGYLHGPPPLEVEVTETSVSYARSFPPAPLASWQAAATGLSAGADYVQRESGVFVTPGLHIDYLDVLADDEVLQTVFIRALTPIDPSSTQILWRSARNFAPGDAAVSERLRGVHLRTMAEDEPLLRAIQVAISAGDSGPQTNAAADAAALKAHQIVRHLLEEERGRPTR